MFRRPVTLVSEFVGPSLLVSLSWSGSVCGPFSAHTSPLWSQIDPKDVLMTNHGAR